MERRDPYRILGVQPDADPDVVKAAYRVLVRKAHPDAALHDEAAEQRIRDLNWAYAIVRDPAERSRNEAARRRTPPPTPAEPRTHGAERGPLDETGAGMRLDFGRYEGWRLGDVARRDIDYLRWLSRHASGARFRPEIERLLREVDGGPPPPQRYRR
jgi:curved DNA-binding protein CbpA